jgi:hypothetical protein
MTSASARTRGCTPRTGVHARLNINVPCVACMHTAPAARSGTRRGITRKTVRKGMCSHLYPYPHALLQHCECASAHAYRRSSKPACPVPHQVDAGIGTLPRRGRGWRRGDNGRVGRGRGYVPTSTVPVAAPNHSVSLLDEGEDAPVHVPALLLHLHSHPRPHPSPSSSTCICIVIPSPSVRLSVSIHHRRQAHETRELHMHEMRKRGEVAAAAASQVSTRLVAPIRA